ncbi:MAG: Ser-Thr-rich GPI-anchored membrane family protein [Promethearchaeota archaeon]
MIVGILTITFCLNFQFLRVDKFNYNDVPSIKTSQDTFTVYDTTPYGSVGGTAPPIIRGENDYFEWSLNTLYGPGLTWYMLNETEFLDLIAMPSASRTRGSFSYTALLSDEEPSASGIFYPEYGDTWWFVAINHYTGINCSVEFTDSWYDDYIIVEKPNSSSVWGTTTNQYINWMWGGDFDFVNIDLYYNDTFLTNIATNAQNNGSYRWRIPDSLTDFDNLYQINITNSDYSGTWNISDYFEIYEIPSITIIYPTIASSWETNSTQIISWFSSSGITDVKIELFKNDIFELEINSSTPSDGSYSWTIPTGLENSTLYQIKITDITIPSTYDYSDYFEIYEIPIIPDSITIIQPTTASSWETNSVHIISWSSTGSITDVKIELFKNDIFELEIISSTPNDGSYSWTIPTGLENSTLYQVKISDLSNPSTNNLSDYFEIYEIPIISESITIIQPTTTTSWETNSVHIISWSSTGGITNVKIELFKNDIFELEIVSSTPNDGNYSWTIPTGLETSTLYQIKITDLSNPSTYDYSEYFQIYSPSSQGGVPGYDLLIVFVALFIGIMGIIVLIQKKKSNINNNSHNF